MTPTLAAQPDPAAGIRGSFEHCRAVTKREAGNFYYGLRLTPEPKRSALYAIYAWMRGADDIADAPGASRDKLARLEAFWERTRLTVAGSEQTGSGPLWPAVVHTIERYGVPIGELEEMVCGLRDDICGDADPAAPRCATFAELDTYCYRVASIAGIICLRIWGLRDPAAWPRARELAVRRGRAFQLTNIIRDIGSDHAEGRVYMPLELFERHDLTVDDLIAWSDDARCAGLAREVIDRARAEYAASSELDELVHADGAGPMWAMTRIYGAILERIAIAPEVVVRRRVSLPTLRKVIIGAQALRRGRSGSG